MRHIAIEGNIGAGKTTLAKQLAEHLGAQLMLEEFAHNPLLPAFYEDPESHAFQLELSFLTDRCEQLRSFSRDENSILVTDYLLEKSQVFSEVNLNNSDFQLFLRIFDQMSLGLPKPDLIIYLFSDVDNLQNNIRQRGRDYEQNIKNEYLEKINDLYESHLETLTIPILRFNSSELITKNDSNKIDLLIEQLQFITKETDINSSS